MQFDITTIIIIITALVSIGGFSNQKIIDDLIFYPPAVKRNQWYRFFSCGLIHADVGHLVFNMLSLYLFGREVEKVFVAMLDQNGKWLYLLMYASSLLVCLLPTYFKHKNNYHYRSLGASGAVSAVIFAGLTLFPGMEVMFFFIPIPIPGFVFGPLYLLISAWLDRRGGGNINHSAHFWGALYGVLFIVVAGRLVGFDAIENFKTGVKLYLQAKGWLH